MMSLSSPGTITNIIHGVKPSTVAVVCDNSLRLDAEIVTEESKGYVAKNIPNNKEMRIIRRVSVSNSSNSSISSSSNESTTAIIYETIDDIICQIENKDLVTSYKVAYQIQKNTEKKIQQLDKDGKEEEDSHNSGELTKSCSSGSIDQECISSPSGNIHTNALNKFLSSPSPTNWELLVSSMKHRSQSPWGDGEFAVINVEGNGEEEGSIVSEFDDSIEENRYAFISKYLKQQADDSDRVEIELSTTAGEEGDVEEGAVVDSSTIEEDEPLLVNAADPENDETQVGIEAATNNEEAADESSPNTIEDDSVHMEASTVDESPHIDEGIYKKLTKRDIIYQSISMCKTKIKSLTRQCRGYKKESYSMIPTSNIYAGGYHNNASIQRLQLPSSVTIINHYAYNGCPNLSDVVLGDGIEEVGGFAFSSCRALERINIPSTVSSIGRGAFQNTKLSSIDLPDSIESIGEECFRECRHLTNVRIPPLVKDLPRRVFERNSFMFSVDVPEDVTHVNITCFDGCASLRNIAFPSNAILSGVQFIEYEDANDVLCHLIMNCKDLKEAYDSMPAQFKLQPIRKALMKRFDGLPIHEILYYQSYYLLETVLKRLYEAMNQKRTNRVLSTTYQGLLGIDWLGMTPLHILACSKRQSIELYQVIVEQYPQNLITKDKFGAEPILYAIWGSAPSEIVQFLAESYKSKHPDYELDWYGMVRTLAKAPSTLVLHILFDIQDTYFPDQKIRRWKSLMEEIASNKGVSAKVFRFVSRRIISLRIDRIGLKRTTRIHDQIDAIPDHACSFYRRTMHVPPIFSNLAIYEHDYQVLKEVVPVLEFAVWKIKVGNEGASTSLSRRVCRYNCGADVVIGHVLPFLLHEDL